MPLISEPDEESYEGKHAEPKPYYLSGSTYDKLKPAAALVLPAINTFWLTIANIWNLPNREEIGATIGAVNILLGVLLLVSSWFYKKSDAKYDGVINVTEHENGLKTASLELKNYENPADVVNQPQALFKVNRLVP